VAGSPALPFLSERRNATVRVDGLSDALSANPSVPRHRLGATNVRVPDTVVDLLEPDGEGGYNTTNHLRRNGYALQTVSRRFALGENTSLLTDVSFRQSGRFTRVDEDGISIHAFPETDWLVGAGISRQIGRALAAGATANWLRSKQTVPAETTRYAHGWTFDIGIAATVTPDWRIGVVARHLGNGISSLGLGVPTEPRREFVLGSEFRQRVARRADVEWAADVRVPSKRGAQVSGGATLVLADRIGVTVGYERRVERWQSLAEDATGTALSDERLWVAEGPTFGASALLGDWHVSGRVKPTYLPRVDGDVRREVVAGRWQWMVALSSER
jgi:hypothetical protein